MAGDTGHAWDVIIAGGGLAGLAAARRLGGLKTLVCDPCAALGGRIETREVDGRPAEMGAMFPSRRLMQWVGIEPSFVPREGGLMVLLPSGEVLKAPGRQGLLQQAQVNNASAEVRDALLRATHFVGASRLARAVVAMAGIDQGLEQAVGGVAGLVDALAVDAGHIWLDAAVESFVPQGSGYRVVIRRGGIRCVEESAALVLAAGTTMSRNLLTAAGLPVPAYVRGLMPEALTVMVLEVDLDAAEIPNYAVIVGGQVQTLVFSPGSGTSCVVTAYAAGPALSTEDEAVVEALILRVLGVLLGKRIRDARLLARRCWLDGVTPVDDVQLQSWRRDDCAPVPGLFLAGDYLYPGHSLGLEPAFIVGTQVGERARIHVRAGQVAVGGDDVELHVTARLRTDLAGVLRGTTREAMALLSPWGPPLPVGDVIAVAAGVAGLRATGVPGDDPLLTEALAWLADAGEDGMWAYTRGGLPTATDSALAMFFVPECDWSPHLHEYRVPGGVLPQLHGDLPGVRRMSAADPGIMHWCQPDPFTTALCSFNERRAGRPGLLDPEGLRMLFRRRESLFVANPFLADLAFLLATTGEDSPEGMLMRREIAEQIARERAGDGLFGTFDHGLSTAAAVLGIAHAGGAVGLGRDDLWKSLRQSAGRSGATPFCSTRYLGRQLPRAGFVPFHECGDILQVNGRLFALTLYRDSLDLVSRGVWLMAAAAVRAMGSGAGGQVQSVASHLRPRHLQPATVNHYCAYALSRFQ